VSRSWSGTMRSEICAFTVPGMTVASMKPVSMGSFRSDIIALLFGPDISMLWMVKEGSLHLEERRVAGLWVTSESSLYSSFSSDVCGRTLSSGQADEHGRDLERITSQKCGI